MTQRDKIEPGRLVQLIVGLTSEQGSPVSRVGLVKLLYLADFFNAHSHDGKTLTGWPWAFTNNGPSCSESLHAIDQAVQRNLILTLSPSGLFRWRFFLPGRFGRDENQVYVSMANVSVRSAFVGTPIRLGSELEDELPIDILSALKLAIKNCDDKPALLDYICFETKPMSSASPGDLLNFSLVYTADRDRPIPTIPLSQDTLQQARSLVKRMREKVEAQTEVRASEPRLRDEQYERTLAALDGEPLTAGLKGEASIKIPRDAGE